MEKMKSSLTNMVVVLVGFALVIGAVLAWVNHITEGPIAQKAEKTLADGIQTVMGTTQLRVVANDTVRQNIGGKETEFVVHKTSDTQGHDLGAAVESTAMGFGGDLKVLVGFDKQGTILGYTILQTSETPGLGAKADKWFQKEGKGSVIGLSPAKGDLTVSKDGGQVDAITASTITSRAFLKAINQAYAAYAQKAVDGRSGASEQHHS
jgi:electron transport complex protein RnfG